MGSALGNNIWKGARKAKWGRHLIGNAVLALSTINFSVALLTSVLLTLLTTLEITVALIQAFVFTLLVSLYLHNNT